MIFSWFGFHFHVIMKANKKIEPLRKDQTLLKNSGTVTDLRKNYDLHVVAIFSFFDFFKQDRC